MKIAFQWDAWDGKPISLDYYGGLELRYSTNWAHWLQSRGHEVVGIHPSRGCDESFDLAFDTPVSETYPCAKWRAKRHIHSYFSPDVSGLTFVDCYNNEDGDAFFSHPTVSSYNQAISFTEPVQLAFKRVLSPIPYPMTIAPPNLSPGFDRTEIMWCNKGNFDKLYAKDHHYYIHGLNTLKALVKLNKKADFKVTFGLRHLIEHRPEVMALISQLSRVEMLPQIPWTDLVNRMGNCKINTHAGGLTSAIFEAVHCGALPFVPNDFGFFNEPAGKANMLPPAAKTTFEEIYDSLERAWFDREFYESKNAIFTEAFEAHRNTEVYWNKLLETVGLKE